MKRRIAVGVVVLLALYIGYREGKGYVKAWYADNYMVRITDFPSSDRPDQVCLTWSGDPRTTQTVQWRTAPTVREGWVEYREAGRLPEETLRTAATRVETHDALLENDPVISRFTADLSGLEPGTAYEYRVGSDAADAWSDWAEFTTAPDVDTGFSFLYFGDVQNGFDYWGELAARAVAAYPDAAFHAVAGDLVNNGKYRDQWDAFFGEAEGIFSRRPIVPCLGNHDYAKAEVPQVYLDTFRLPENGPELLEPERAYSFRYANAFFVILDSNRSIADQAPWLEEQLQGSDATWNIVMYHHPAYASAPNRDNREVRHLWVPLFEAYGVDLALQGHDHAYLRTYPLRGGQPVDPGAGGVYYAVAVAGNKYYEQETHAYAEVAFPETSTYQIIDIRTDPDVLEYRAYDFDGNLRDRFTIEKDLLTVPATTADTLSGAYDR